jgi:hypothetical protein
MPSPAAQAVTASGDLRWIRVRDIKHSVLAASLTVPESLTDLFCGAFAFYEGLRTRRAVAASR